MEHLKEKGKYYTERLHDLLEEDFYAALPRTKATCGHQIKT